MRYLLAFLPALACVGLMYGCIRMMMSGSHGAGASQTPDLEARVHELEQELEQLRAERGAADRPLEV
jgi:hypothetical protein